MKSSRQVILDSLDNDTPAAWWKHLEEEALKEIHPDLLKGKGCAQDIRYHNEDVFQHTMRAVAYTGGKPHYHPLLKLAVLQHDVGKPPTKGTGVTADGQPYTTFYNHDVIGAQLTTNWMKKHAFPPYEVDYVSRLVRHHLFRFEGNSYDRRILRFLKGIGEENWRDMMRLRIADRRGNQTRDHKPTIPYMTKLLIKRIRKLTQPQPEQLRLALSGHDLIALGLAPGPLFKEYLKAARALVEEDETKNDKELLTQLARTWIDEESS